MINTPILLVIFNRPDKVKQLIDSLRKVKPTIVYVSADGPRKNVITDAARCANARTTINQIDWPCKVVTNFHEANTGSDFGPEKALNWFFDNVEEGIILEDDCIAHPDFFRFAQDMLSRYRNNEQIMLISGNNFQNGIIRGDGSYYFSKYPNTWGWASWKRAWKNYDTNTAGYDDFLKSGKINTICQSSAEKKFWLKFFNQIHTHKLEHWDIKWSFAVWNNDGIVIIPNVNLVKNIGFGLDATHTLNENEKTMVVNAVELGEIIHPKVIQVDREADAYIFHHLYKFTLTKKLSYLAGLIKNKFN